MSKNQIAMDIDDPRAGKIAEALSNKTAKNILNQLVEGEMSGSEIASKLGIPINTVGYNLKKLVSAGLVDKTKKVFWSSRGKRMEIYKISNKKIVISPKSMAMGILPALVVVAIGALWIKSFVYNKVVSGEVLGKIGEVSIESVEPAAAGLEESAGSAVSSGERIISDIAPEVLPRVVDAAQSNAWAWFLLGGMVALLVLLLWNWRRFK